MDMPAKPAPIQSERMKSRLQRRWFAQRVDEIIGSHWTAEYQATMAEIERLAMDEAKGRHGEEKSLIYRRIICDLRLMTAHQKRRSITECEALYSDRVRLGFETLADEATTVSAHARYCRQIGKTEMASKYAVAVLKNPVEPWNGEAADSSRARSSVAVDVRRCLSGRRRDQRCCAPGHSEQMCMQVRHARNHGGM